MAKNKYEVLHKFIDLEDKKKVYDTGDTYPKPANKKSLMSVFQSFLQATTDVEKR